MLCKVKRYERKVQVQKNTTENRHTVSVTTLFSFVLINNPQHFPIGLFIILWRKFHSWRKCFSIHWHLLQPHPSKLTEKTTCSLRNSSYLRRLGCQQMTFRLSNQPWIFTVITQRKKSTCFSFMICLYFSISLYINIFNCRCLW